MIWVIPLYSLSPSLEQQVRREPHVYVPILTVIEYHIVTVSVERFVAQF
jgi:hypothetical protein